MVYYIRFLKPPRVSRLHVDRDDALVSTMITITTDLGDAFYPGNLCIHTAIDYEGVMTSLALSKWEPGMRVLKIEARTLVNNPRSRSKFFFTANKSLGIDSLQLDRIPDIVSAWTEEFSQWDDLDTNVTLRRFQLPCSQVLEICEENGESMARHIWDGGVVLAAWLTSSMTITGRHPDDSPFSILELGTGCGTVGLAFARRWMCHLILTDEDDDALRFAKQNARKSRHTVNSAWECQPLDWVEAGKYKLDRALDFIIASECIYNPDSIPNLVHTISELVRQSKGLKAGLPQPRIIVSTKVRHWTEAAFFGLMKTAGFEQQEHESIAIPDNYRESIGQDLERVEIYVFEYHNEGIIAER